MSIETVSVKEDGVITLSNEKETKTEAPAEVTEETQEDEDLEETELAAAGEVSEETQEEVKPKKKGGFQKKLERKDREIEDLRSQLAARSEPQTATKEAVSIEEKEPVIDDYDTHSAYTKALTKYTFKQMEAEKAAQTKAVEAVDGVKKTIETYHSKLSEFKKSTPDLDDVLEDVNHIRLSGSLQEAIITSDLSAELTYELAKNPEEFERINKLSPLATAKEIGRLELKLSQAAENRKAATQEEETKTKTTKAPAPLKSLSGKASTVVTKNINDMNFKEYAKYMDDKERKAQKRA